MAFGAQISAKNYDVFIQESNERLKDVNFNTEFIEVDAIFNPNNLNMKMLYEFAAYNYVYGNSIPMPKIVIEGTYSGSQAAILGDGTTVRFTFGKLNCIKFKDAALAAKVKNSSSGKFTIIGKLKLNEYNGYISTQLMIDNIEIEPIAAKSLF